MRNPFAVKTLQNKIIISLFGLIILPVSVIMFRFHLSSIGIVEKQLYQSYQYAVEQKAAEMNNSVVRIVKASNLIINDSETMAYLRQQGDWHKDYPTFNAMIEVQNKLYNIRDLLLDSNAYVALLSDRDVLLSTWGPVMEISENFRQLGEEAKKYNGLPHWMLTRALVEENEEQHLLVMSRFFQNQLGRGQGTILIGTPASIFYYPPEELLEQQKAGIYSFILLDGGRLFGEQESIGLSSDLLEKDVEIKGNGIRTIRLGEKMYQVNEAAIPQLGWTLIQLIGHKDFEAKLSQAKYKSIGWVALWFVVFIFAFIILMFRFTNPMKQLRMSMKRLGAGYFDAAVEVKGEDEVALLGHHFNKMAEKLKETMTNLEAEQERKRNAQFHALQAQINPHFLLNTMNSIKWMAILSGSEHVSEMITKLGKLLGYTMNQREDVVTLGQELDYLSVYMSLQQIRYHDDIVIETDVLEDLLPLAIMKFTLQPIVENSILHGGKFPLRIRIHAEERAKELVITVKDNGLGMSEEKLREVEERMNQPHAKFSGIGIRNVHERIQLQWGEPYGVRLDSKPDEGVCVTITLPLQRRSWHDPNPDCR